jgi:hypothetical protein
VVAVTRRGSQEKLPGETRILRSFCDACALHRKRLAGAPEVSRRQCVMQSMQKRAAVSLVAQAGVS